MMPLLIGFLRDEHLYIPIPLRLKLTNYGDGGGNLGAVA